MLHSACEGAAAPPPAPPGPPEELVVKVLRTFPHQSDAFTQGLVFYDGRLYESTGLPGRSSLRRVAIESGAVEDRIALPAPLFGEGLARVDDALVQITWQNERAFVWSVGDFHKRREYHYTGEGWGLCYDGRRLVMSDGSQHLTFRNPDSFEIAGGVDVVRDGQPVLALNELECVDGAVYANIWQTQSIVRIDPASGRVTASIDASDLLTPDERTQTDVLNGIAYWPERKSFLITGKLWPKLFEVQFVPRAERH
jgi:glutaminyl-peptide cyclotransferase